MSVPMRKHRTDQVEILINTGREAHFVGPRRKLKLIRDLLSELDFEPVKEKQREGIPWREVARDRIDQFGEPALALRGARLKEELSQSELASRLKIPQYNLSKMENGTRPIGKKMARKLSKILKIDYRIFL